MLGFLRTLVAESKRGASRLRTFQGKEKYQLKAQNS
jgi:hypothetical protein